MIRVVLFFLALLATSQASASTSGFVTGQVRFYNEQIGYTNNAGPHDNYKSTEFQTMQPVRGVRVELRNISFGNLLGYTFTDINGYYSMNWWSSPNVFSGYIRVVWADNGRLKVTPQADGTQYYTDFVNQSLTTGNNSSNPQVLATCDAGSPTVQFPWANIFDASWRMWYYAFKYSSPISNNLWNKPIRWPSTACPTSCGSATGVHLDGGLNTWKASPWRASHELGHVAQFVVASGQNPSLCNKLSYPATTNGGTWSHNTPEWTCTSYNEGFPSFLATVSRHWYNSTLARECLSNEVGQCNLNVESSAGSLCVPAVDQRWPLTTQRFFWDSYDAQNDGEANTIGFAQMVQNHAAFAPGTANRKRDEWNNGAANLSGGQPIEDGTAAFDGSSAGDYWWNIWTSYGINLDPSYFLNCTQQYD